MLFFSATPLPLIGRRVAWSSWHSHSSTAWITAYVISLWHCSTRRSAATGSSSPASNATAASRRTAKTPAAIPTHVCCMPMPPVPLAAAAICRRASRSLREDLAENPSKSAIFRNFVRAAANTVLMISLRLMGKHAERER